MPLHSSQPLSIFKGFALERYFSSATPMLGFCRPHSHQSSQSSAYPLLTTLLQSPYHCFPNPNLIAHLAPYLSSFPLQTLSCCFSHFLTVFPFVPAQLGHQPHCVCAGGTPKPGSREVFGHVPPYQVPNSSPTVPASCRRVIVTVVGDTSLLTAMHPCAGAHPLSEPNTKTNPQ